MRRWIVYGLVATLLASALIWIGILVGLNKSDWAAWVQAVGSIAAIVGAFELSEASHRRLRRDLEESQAHERQRRASLIFYCVNGLNLACEWFVEHQEARGSLPVGAARVLYEQAAAPVIQIDLREVPTTEMAEGIRQLQMFASALTRTLNQLPSEALLSDMKGFEMIRKVCTDLIASHWSPNATKG